MFFWRQLLPSHTAAAGTPHFAIVIYLMAYFNFRKSTVCSKLECNSSLHFSKYFVLKFFHPWPCLPEKKWVGLTFLLTFLQLSNLALGHCIRNKLYQSLQDNTFTNIKSSPKPHFQVQLFRAVQRRSKSRSVCKIIDHEVLAKYRQKSDYIFSA